MPDLSFHCPECNQVYNLGAEFAGKKLRCVKCSAIFRPPAEVEAHLPSPRSAVTSGFPRPEMSSSEARPRPVLSSETASAALDDRANKQTKLVRPASKTRWILPILAGLIALGYLGASGAVFFQIVGQKPFATALAQLKSKDPKDLVGDGPNRRPPRRPGIPIPAGNNPGRAAPPGNNPGPPPARGPGADPKKATAWEKTRKERAEAEQKIIAALAMTEAVRNHKGSGLLSLVGNSGNVKRIVFSPTEPLLAALTQQLVVIWDLTTGTVKHKLQEHKDSLDCIAFSPDGKTLVAGGNDPAVQVWDVATGAMRKPLEGHPGGIHGLAFSPDGNWIVAAGDPDLGGGGKSSIQVWNVTTGTRVPSPPNSRGWIEFLAFVPASSVFAYLDGTIKGPVLVDVTSGKLVPRPFTRLNFRCNSLAFSPDGSRVLLGEGARDNPTAQMAIYDLATGTITPMPAVKGTLRAVAWSPDGNTVAFDGASALTLWDVSAGKLLRRVEEKPNDLDFSGLAFSPGGTMLATSDGHDVKLWVVADMLAPKVPVATE